MNRLVATLFVGLFFVSSSLADGPEDNDPLDVRPIPPVGIEVESSRRDSLLARCVKIRQQLSELDVDDRWVCQVEVFPRAVEMTLDTQMIYAVKDLKVAGELLDEAERRLVALQQNRSGEVLKNSDDPNLLVGGFRSKIDGSVQPYGLEMPDGWNDDDTPMRLDVWLHGRGERTSEVGFLNQRLNKAGQYSPADTMVLHPYGRYSNAFKFAGEIDVMEAIEHIKKIFSIDEKRIAIRGFSMGGAGCWQLAVHYPNVWAAANPGAGFSETIEFLKFFQLEDFEPTWYEKRLLHWYDCPDWTNNLRNVPTVAYSGEIDRQKQAADVMEVAFESRGMKLPHVIGPDTAHKIHEESKAKIQLMLDAHLEVGKDTLPHPIDLTTYTLRYHKLGWLSIKGLGEHWKEARVVGHLNRKASQRPRIVLDTNNVTRLAIELPTGFFAADAEMTLLVDNQPIPVQSKSDGSVGVQIAKPADAKWVIDSRPPSGLIKRPGLQGPIDDAFMDAFTFIGPDSNDPSSIVDTWIGNEFRHAKGEWERHFRGDVVEVASTAVTNNEIASRNLVLFGTPKSNSLIAKIADQLPIKWNRDGIQVGDATYGSNHVPVLIYPNPLNPERYVVINSGFTYREYAYLNNARQIPMLPDWAIVDVSSGSTTQFPGKIEAAGFFDEQWKLK